MERWILFALLVCFITGIEVTNLKFISNNCGDDLELIICIGFILAGCLALLETKLETIDNTKNIRLLEIHKVGNKYAYALIVDAA